jgi:hypothetical protein
MLTVGIRGAILNEAFDAALRARFKVQIFPDFVVEEGVDVTHVVGLLLYGHHGLFDGAVVSRFPNVRAVANVGVGVDHIAISVRFATTNRVPLLARLRCFKGLEWVADCLLGCSLLAARC